MNAKQRNRERANAAHVALNAFAEEMVQIRSQRELQSDQEWLVDLLSDLRHMARQRGLDFEKTLQTSETHFNCEVDEEQEGGEQ